MSCCYVIFFRLQQRGTCMKIAREIFHDFPRPSSHINERRCSNTGSFRSLLELNYIQDFDFQQTERGCRIKTDVWRKLNWHLKPTHFSGVRERRKNSFSFFSWIAWWGIKKWIQAIYLHWPCKIATALSTSGGLRASLFLSILITTFHTAISPPKILQPEKGAAFMAYSVRSVKWKTHRH